MINRNNNAEWFLMDLWRDFAGLPPQTEIKLLPDLKTIMKSQWSEEFERYMRNRLVMGAFRYGLIEQDESKNYNHISSVRKRLDKYEETGNLEYLVDIANLMMLEFLHSTHPDKHFKATDDGVHSKKY